jgi:hypothetical protein
MTRTKEEFVGIIKALRDFVASDESKECTCPNTRCEFHGDCYNCVRIYRHFGQHIPRCLQYVLEKKLANISQAVEKEVGKREKTPDEFYDHLNTVLPKTDI